jgi:hypothetical protein
MDRAVLALAAISDRAAALPEGEAVLVVTHGFFLETLHAAMVLPYDYDAHRLSG